MATDQPTGTDAAMHRALSAYLPDPEPPIGLQVEHVVALGRRRHRMRRAVPIAAAALTVLAIALPWSIGSAGPTPGRVPAGDTMESQESQESQSASTGTSSSVPAPTRPELRVPAGHQRDKDADALTKAGVNRLPAGRVATYFGTRSDELGRGERYGYGFHFLWKDGDRYGYLVVLHRTKGEFPASIYGLPAEPCLNRSTGESCTPMTAPSGDAAASFDIDRGYRMRGIIWDKKDPATGVDIRVTVAFYLPTGGAWTPFSILDDHPTLTAVPLTIQDLARLAGMPQ